MSKFVPNKEHSQTALIFCFHLKKTAESYQLFREAYDEHAPSQDTCERWFRRLKSGDFDVADKDHGKPSKRYENVELQALLDENGSQTQKQLTEQLSVSQQAVSNRLREMGMVYYELLKPAETVNTKRYIEKGNKIIFLHDNAPSHTAKSVRDTLEALNWEVLAHAAYSPDFAPSDYHLFALMGHALAEQRFGSYKDVKKWLDE
ncbi:MOS1T transposase, partial [Pseudoatta argentina]